MLNNAATNGSRVFLAAGKENLILNGGDELRAKLTQLEDLHKKGALLTAAANIRMLKHAAISAPAVVAVCYTTFLP